MKIINCIQNSPAWFEARCGIPSASNFDKIITTDGKVSKQRTKYLYQLAGERASGLVEESYKNSNMLRGQELEDEARDYYSFITGQDIVQVGFCLADGYGASPDGIIGDDGLLEIKCPIMSTQVGYLLEGDLPSEYFQQVQGQLFVTSRQWLEFLSYYPGLKPLIIHVERDEKFIKALKTELKTFCQELEEITERINQ